MEDTSAVQSVVRTFGLLEILCEKGELGITELSKLSGLSKATVFRLINTLCSLGYVRKNEKTGNYGITLKFLKISSRQLSMYDMRIQLRPILEKLSAECGETVHLIERSGNDIVYIDKIESLGNKFHMASHIGMTLPLIFTAGGKAILSHLNDEEIYNVWHNSHISARTPKTITDLKGFMDEINKVRKNGFAIDDEENETGVKCVSFAINDAEGEYRYAVSVSAPAIRMNDEKIANIQQLFKYVKSQL